MSKLLAVLGLLLVAGCTPDPWVVANDERLLAGACDATGRGLPSYWRDKRTGLCFAFYTCNGSFGLAHVPCGVVEGTVARLQGASR